jgi:hypothetical protein
MPQRSLQEITESAAARISPVKVTAKESNREFLAQFGCDLGVAHDSKKIPIDGAMVAQQQLLLGCKPSISLRLMSTEKDGPACFDRR